MIEAAFAPVQLVTTGVDWTAVTAAIVGGVVGLAGIVFAWRQSKMTISAEDQRIKLAEKRRIYANCLAALQHAQAALQHAEGVATDDPPTESADAATPAAIDAAAALTAADAAVDAAMTACFEVAIIAPVAVYRPVATILKCLADQPEEGLGDALGQVLVAMRVDLGETKLPVGR